MYIIILVRYTNVVESNTHIFKDFIHQKNLMKRDSKVRQFFDLHLINVLRKKPINLKF